MRFFHKDNNFKSHKQTYIYVCDPKINMCYQYIWLIQTTKYYTYKCPINVDFIESVESLKTHILYYNYINLCCLENVCVTVLKMI